MKALAIVMALAAVAHADSVKPPAGWHSDTELAGAHAAKLRQLTHFAGGRVDYGVGVYVPDTPGIVLYVTRMSTTANSPAAIGSALADFELSSHAPGIEVLDASKRADDTKKQLEAKLALRDKAGGTITASALVMAADAKQLVEVTGDCIARDDLDARLVDACKQALATLDPDVSERVAIALAAVPAPAPTPAPEPAPAGSSSGSRMDDGSRLGPIAVVPQEPSGPDRRPLFLGAGMIALALVFWWNRRRRERFEREDRGESPDKERDDADDLHAAAKGDDDDR